MGVPFKVQTEPCVIASMVAIEGEGVATDANEAVDTNEAVTADKAGKQKTYTWLIIASFGVFVVVIVVFSKKKNA